jgi:hypothetical protein
MLDEEEVLKHFLGKTQTEILAALPNSGHFQEDFMWMRPAGLSYYLPAVADYLRSSDSHNDFEMSEGLLCSLSFQVRQNAMPESVLRQVRELARIVDEGRDKYGLGKENRDLDRYLAQIKEGTAHLA